MGITVIITTIRMTVKKANIYLAPIIYQVLC